MKKSIFFILIIILSTTVVDAQRTSNKKSKKEKSAPQYNNGYGNRRRAPSLSMGIQVLDPQGQFNDLYDRHPAGISGLFSVNWGLSPIEFGFGASWHQLGNAKENITIIDGENNNGNSVFVDGKLAVKSNLYTYQAIGRFKPMAGPIQPYVDVVGGFRTFSTKTVLKKVVDGTTEIVSDERDKRDFALMHGWAGGLKIRLNDYLMVEGRVEFMKGSQVEFIDTESIEIDYFGDVQYQEVSSSSNMRIFHLGISVEF